MWGCSSAGRALRSQRRGREFDPPQLHKFWSGLLDLNLPNSVRSERKQRSVNFSCEYSLTFFYLNIFGVIKNSKIPAPIRGSPSKTIFAIPPFLNCKFTAPQRSDNI